MNIPVFELERIQSLYENTVPINLTESGFHPYTLKELLTPAQLDTLTNTVLGYGQTNGSPLLRARIAALYPACTKAQVLVTNGSAEANFVACHTLLSPGDEIVMMVPNYMQIWGIAEEIGCIPKAFHLREENQWAPDLDELARQITPKTKMIAVCNPNNPTGYVLSGDEMRAIAALAEHHGCWIFADEVYRGADLDGVEKPSFLGMTERVLVNGGLSKAYALPGARIGWLAGPEALINTAWAYHDYTTITAGILSHHLAEIALHPDVRPTIFARNRAMLQTNLAVLTDWVASFKGRIGFVPPQAGGMVFLHYDFPISSTDLSDWLRLEHGVFVLAGDVYGMAAYFRIGIGAETAYLKRGLDVMGAALNNRFGS